ncbi:MAG: saccharopine dehydrogenase NADP-binding domain-containing protein [Thaumarchaeota archaeon]|nr:saccharopine dehydrogenase NADP-binding domain-containing protein [Candidatus Geocrenenecus arthurdayi]
MPRKVMVIGVGGVGHVVVVTLISEKLVDQIVAIDVSDRNLKHLQEKFGGEKISIYRVDARNFDQLSRLMKEVDIVVNAAHYSLNLGLIDTCLKNGCNYISLTGGEELWIEGGSRFKEMIEAHLKRDSEWRESRLTGILGLGEDPGLSNIFTRYLVEKLDEVDEVIIRDADTVEDSRFIIAPLWSREELLMSSIAPAVYYEDGVFKKAEPLSICEEYVFPSPIGPKKIYLKEHPEVWTLPVFLPKKVRKISFWYNYDGISAEVIKALWKMNLLSREKINVKGVQVSPFDVVVEVLPQPLDLVEVPGYAGIEVEVKGIKDNSLISGKIFTYVSHREAYNRCGLNGTSYLVGLPAAIGVTLLLKRELKDVGLLFPEQLNPHPFIRELLKHNLPVIFEERRITEIKEF